MLTDTEARRMVPLARAGLTALGPLKRPRAAGIDAALAAGLALCDEAERDYRRKVAKWEADRPYREAAERASRAASARRRAELGLGPGERIPVAASAVFERPRKPVMW